PGPAQAPAPAPERGAPSNGEAPSGAKLLSPVVRRLINENDLDPSQIQGTGPGGRITRNDVLAVLDEGAAAAPAPAAPEAPAPQAPAPAAPEAPAPQAPAPQAPAPQAPAPPTPRPAPQPVARPGERDTV